MSWKRVKKWFLGNPLATHQISHEKLSNPRALAIFSSDALSSVAYATEAILLALLVAGQGALRVSLPISFAILALLAIVISSYRQTVVAYPQGGGSYIVAKDNLGLYPGLVAAAALLIDYVLTVAVSVSAATSALVSAFPEINEYRRLVGFISIGLLAFINLRGLRETGRVFLIPTFAFVVCIYALILTGLGRLFFDSNFHPPKLAEAVQGTQTLGIFLILRAFASGCTALTGIEAISDGAAAFRNPTGQNAKKTLMYLGIMLGTLFLGITFLVHRFGVIPSGSETALSQLAKITFAGTIAAPLYFCVQAATVLILVLASNTAFSDFPRLAQFLARDEFLPKQFASIGHRLVYSVGIVVLTLSSAILVWLFNAREHALLPFYAIGVFTAFTLSQAGMTVFWWKRQEISGWNWLRVFLGVVGALVTGIVFALELVTKAGHGAFLVPILVVGFIVLFQKIKKHYARTAGTLAVGEYIPRLPFKPKHTVVVPIEAVNRATLKALAHVVSRKPSRILAVHVALDMSEAAKLSAKWEKHVNRLRLDWTGFYEGEIPLEIIHCEYPQEESVVDKILDFIRSIDRRYDDDTVTVVMPHLVFRGLSGRFLHNHTTMAIEHALEEAPDIDVDVEFVPYRIR